MGDVSLAPASDRLKRASERGRTRDVGLGLTGGPDEEPVAEHVAQRRQQRRWGGARLRDGGDAPPAECPDEGGWALSDPGPRGTKEAGQVKAPEESQPVRTIPELCPTGARESRQNALSPRLQLRFASHCPPDQ